VAILRIGSYIEAFDEDLLSAKFDDCLNVLAIHGGVAAVSKIVPSIAGFALAVALGCGLRPGPVLAAKVDCSKVMSELNSGKKVAEVATDLRISPSSVYRCRHNARRAGTAAASASSPTAAGSAKSASGPHH
jgi:hypothetical protein